MSDTVFNPERYGSLLANIRPTVIESPEEHDRLLTVAEELMDKGAELDLEEHKVLELLVLLIRCFEEQVDREAGDHDDDEAEDSPCEESSPQPPEPYETLHRLLESRGWDPGMLNDVFGNPQLVGQVLSGKRDISRGQAKSLSKLFNVPFKLFLK